MGCVVHLEAPASELVFPTMIVNLFGVHTPSGTLYIQQEWIGSDSCVVKLTLQPTCSTHRRWNTHRSLGTRFIACSSGLRSTKREEGN